MTHSQVAPSTGAPHRGNEARHRWIGLVIVAYVLLSILTLVLTHADVLPLERRQLLRAHVMCAAFGMLGAAVRLARKYYKTLITTGQATTFTYGWLVYYVARPPIGAIVAAMLYLLTFVGVRIMTHGGNSEISQEGRMILFGAAFLAGYGASDALNRIEAASSRLFSSANEHPL